MSSNKKRKINRMTYQTQKNNPRSKTSKEKSGEVVVIEIKQILKAITTLLATCNERGLSDLKIPHHMYWCVDPDEAFKLESPQPELGVGDLFDDAEFVKNIEKLKPGLAGLHLTNIASLLNYIGSRYPSLGPH